PAGRAAAHVVHLRDRDDLYRGHFAVGGRHRHHEHHAGDGVGAHSRNRYPAGHRCTPGRYCASVPDGGGADLDCRRVDRHRVRLHVVAGDRDGGGLVHGGDHVIDCGGLRRLRFYWFVVWNLSGRTG